MQKRKLGCLTPLGILVFIFTLMLLLALGVTRGGAMFSPGELNAQAGTQPRGGVSSHAETGGRCSACHTPPWSRQGMSERCLECHTELVTDPEDFHNIMLAQSHAQGCYECHTDHQGLEASLTTLDLKTFPHLSLGYSLQAHQTMANGQPFVCRDCHPSGVAQFDLAVCTDCHTKIDPAFMQSHLQEYGQTCLDCHDGVDRFGKGFDHNQLEFPLIGRHAGVTCGECHTNKVYKGTPQECAACHIKDDAHQGRFGQSCEGCHTPEDWAKASFDHSKSAFPLTGAHTNTPCEKCHVDNTFKGTPQECAACHTEPAFHAGRFPGDCAACHSTAAWTPAQFNQPHTFPINHGEGGASTCRTCHPDSLQTYTCYGCHEHNQAEIAAKHIEEGIGDFSDCIRCHPTGQEEEEQEGGGGDD
jgi:hypothetical protein